MSPLHLQGRLSGGEKQVTVCKSRNETYQGIATIPEAVVTHIVSDFQLDRVGGSGSVYWSRLFLHTWNISYLSGVSVWNNTEFGISFTRI